MQGELQPTIYRFKLGASRSPRSGQQGGPRGHHPNFGANASAEVHALAARKQHRPPALRASVHPILVNTGKELVLFDTGNGALPREYEQLKARLPPGKRSRGCARPATSRKTSTSSSPRTAIPTTSAA